MPSGRPEKKEGYGVMTLARRLIFQRAEVTLMGDDSRTDEDTAVSVADLLDEALEHIFRSWLAYRGRKNNYEFDRGNWDRTKWERRLVVGMAGTRLGDKYLRRAQLHEGGIWAGENYGDGYEF